MAQIKLQKTDMIVSKNIAHPNTRDLFFLIMLLHICPNSFFYVSTIERPISKEKQNKNKTKKHPTLTSRHDSLIKTCLYGRKLKKKKNKKPTTFLQYSSGNFIQWTFMNSS